MMTPHRNTRRTKQGERVTSGSYVIARVFKHIGRVHMASGILSATTFRAFNNGLTEMAKEHAGREWIRAMHRREVAPLDLWGVYKEGRWREPPRPDAAKPLVPALKAWREDTFAKKEVAKSTYTIRGVLITHVEAVARAGATVEELPTVLRAMRAKIKARGARQFNLDREYARAFVRDILGRRNPVYLGIVDVPPITIKRSQKRTKHPLSPAQVLHLAASFSTTKPGGGTGAPGHGHDAINMAMTGMGPEEYFGEWSQHATHVHVGGTKRDARVRDVPKLFPSALWPHLAMKRSTITRHSFERAFAVARKVAKLACEPYDLRRSFANWMEAAKIPRTRRNIYRGHGPKDVGDLYEWHEIREHLVADAELLKAWLAEQLAPSRSKLVVHEVRR